MPDEQTVQRLTEVVARLAGCEAAGVQVRLRAPLDHQSNNLYDAWADGRHLIIKEYLRPEELSTGPEREHRALELFPTGQGAGV